jgi:glycosyltransferase involved in cell wall biosynthesis
VTSDTAVIHEWYAGFGGSETVALELRDVLDAELHVLYVERGTTAPPGARGSALTILPFLQHKQAAVPLTPLAWRVHRASPYKTVVTSSHALGHTARLPQSRTATYLSYVHTPARYVWTPDLDHRAAGSLLAPARAALRTMDRRLSSHVTAYAANSREVAARIRRFWNRDADVIYPPVDVEYFSPGDALPGEQQRPLLSVGRFIGYKRHDFAIGVAEAAGRPLVLAGSGPLEKRLRQQAAGAAVPVTFVIAPTRAELRELYRSSVALVFAAHEDFGMVPVEAMAVGTPVLAYAAGGVLETVQPGLSGALVGALDPVTFAARVEEVASLDRLAISDSVQHFSRARFRDEIARWVARFSPVTAPGHSRDA